MPFSIAFTRGLRPRGNRTIAQRPNGAKACMVSSMSQFFFNSNLRQTQRPTILVVSALAPGKPSSPHERLAYGLRLGEQGPTAPQFITLRSKWQEGRRFELCRALGDTLWASADILGPLAKTSTVRQKFQRAFAQSLLCPFEELQEVLDTDCPDDDIAAAARHFHVAERVVQTVLVNKQVVERGRFTDLLEAA